MTARNQPLSPLSVDIEQVVFDMNRIFNPLHKDFILDYKVQASRDGYVLLTIAMPDGMTRAFASMLESMSVFFKYMQNRIKVDKSVSSDIDSKELLRRQMNRDEFQDKVCQIFDSLLVQGHSTREAVRLTNVTLKEQDHPWACYDNVIQTLRSLGCLRKNYRLKHAMVPSLSTSQRADP